MNGGEFANVQFEVEAQETLFLSISAGGLITCMKEAKSFCCVA